MKGTLLITAANLGLENSPEASVQLLKAIRYYDPLDLSILVAVPLGTTTFVSDHSSSFESTVAPVELPTKMAGALATAVYTLSVSSVTEGNLFIASGDTYFSDDSVLRELERLSDDKFDAGTVGFESEDERYSFVSVNRENRATLVAEKKRISNIATTGNFFFARTEEFLEGAIWCFKNNAALNEKFYVSAALNYFIYAGKDVGVGRINSGLINKKWTRILENEKRNAKI